MRVPSLVEKSDLSWHHLYISYVCREFCDKISVSVTHSLIFVLNNHYCLIHCFIRPPDLLRNLPAILLLMHHYKDCILYFPYFQNKNTFKNLGTSTWLICRGPKFWPNRLIFGTQPLWALLSSPAKFKILLWVPSNSNVLRLFEILV